MDTSPHIVLKSHETECNTGFILKTKVFWDVTLSRWASISGRLLVLSSSWARRPWRWSHYNLLKRRILLSHRDTVTFKNTFIFSNSAVRTSNFGIYFIYIPVLLKKQCKFIIVQCIHRSLKRIFTPLFAWELRSTILHIARLGCVEFNSKNAADFSLS